MFTMQGKVGVVTGASRGIGLAIARALVEGGAQVMMASRNIELGPARIRVNAIAPGLVDTRLASGLVNDESFSAEWKQRTPLGRIAKPEEIAGAALYLASDASSFTTGEVLVIDGGVTAG